ncbi:MAG: TIGR02678 family protein [Micromonosporaceae bacterium]
MTRPLAQVMDSQRDEERARALRALLRHPLLTPRGPDPAMFRLVRKHAEWLRDWFGNQTGWALLVDTEVARLRKTPVELRDASRPAVAGAARVTYSRRRYVLTCLALAALERADKQVTLGWLAERILALAAAPELAAAGVGFTLERREERADLVAVSRLLLELHALVKVAGDEQAYVNATGDALYDVNRPVLASLLTVRRGPSVIGAADLPGRLAALTEDPPATTEEARNRQLRHALARRMLDDPVVYYADLSEPERAYLASQWPFLTRRLTEATGLVAEVRAEGIALVDPTGEATDLKLPDEGTDGHATLLLAEHLAETGQGAPVAVADLRRHVAALAVRHRAYWRKAAAQPGGEVELTRIAIDRLVALGLAQHDGEAVSPLPALARYRYGEPVLTGGREQ